jgi:hypothetical protein
MVVRKNVTGVKYFTYPAILQVLEVHYKYNG